MKYIIILIIALFSYSCRSSNSSNSNNFSLPDSNMINNVIISVIKLDSLRYDHKLIKELRKIKVDIVDILPSNNAPMPPPMHGGVYYFQLFDIFHSNNASEKYNDSIFFSLQSNRAEDFMIADSIYKRFSHSSELVYIFYEPIFSSDKKNVYVKYWDNCGPLCGLCYADLLNWTGSEWIKSKRWDCGEK